MNDMIDLDTARLNALRTHVPGAVWMLVLVVAASGCSAGVSGARTSLSNNIPSVLIAVVITLISDLDRPRQGLVGISQQPMLDLKTSISDHQNNPSP